MNTSAVTQRPIGQMVTRISNWDPAKAAPDAEFLYIDIASVDREDKEIAECQLLLGSEAPSRARQRVQVGDVLVSTVRPGLNAVARVPTRLAEATASTGFTVLRPNPNDLDPGYLFHFVRTRAFVAYLERNATGASYPAVSDAIVENALVPWRPLSEQAHIADLLDRADAIRRKRREALRLADELIRATFLEMFGDPVANERQWPTATLGELTTDLRYGTSTKCSESRGETDLPVLRIPNVIGGRVGFGELKYATLPASERRLTTLAPGDLLFVRSNGNPEYIGRCAVFSGAEEEYLFASYLIRARFKAAAAVKSEFVRHQLSTPSYRSALTGMARTTAGNFNVSAETLSKLRIVTPPVALQVAFLGVVASADTYRLAAGRGLGEAESLFASLQNKAFSGAEA